jgi:nucleotide-binding universal stress UspA family protein
MFQKILVAINRDEQDQLVFEKAISLAKAINAQLMLLHVLSPLEEGYPTPVYPVPDSIYPTQHDEMIRQSMQEFAAFEQVGLNMLRSHQQIATAAGIMTEFTQSTGDPGATICEVAKNWGADLIMVGRRGRAGLTELLLGSVSNHVMHHAACSVLIVQNASERTSQPESQTMTANS